MTKFTKEMQKNIVTVVVLNVALLAIAGFMMLVYPSHIAPLVPSIVNVILFPVGWWFLLLSPTVILMVKDKERPRDIGFTKKKLPRQILLGIALAAGLLVVFSVGVPWLLGLVEWHWGGADQIDVGFIFLSLAYNTLVVGLIEEVIYRGHMFKKLQDIHAAPWFAVLISALAFGAFHIPSFVIIGQPLLPASGWFYVFMATMAGVAYGLCRAKGATMVTLILSHGIYNATFASVLTHMHY
ncbi:MAG: CPBP family intramembrane metalloprotease [Defluviitaleaceae bacterium]|nr:CPBP family intramembrane metalloprotease [Defluviitaleaceae bacterium]